MKTILNADQAICLECFDKTVAILDEENRVVCEFCGSDRLMSKGLKPFEPVFGDDVEQMYRASQYTPSLPDRRMMRRTWPKYKERRRGMSV